MSNDRAIGFGLAASALLGILPILTSVITSTSPTLIGLNAVLSALSRWAHAELDANDLAGPIHNRMPLWYYLPLHSEAHYDAPQKAAISAALPGMDGINMGGS